MNLLSRAGSPVILPTYRFSLKCIWFVHLKHKLLLAGRRASLVGLRVRAVGIHHVVGPRPIQVVFAIDDGILKFTCYGGFVVLSM